MSNNVFPDKFDVNVVSPTPLPVSVSLPDPLPVSITSPDPLPVSTLGQGTNYIDQAIASGNYFSGDIERVSTAPETVYRVIKTGALPMIMEHIETVIDYASIADGEFTLHIHLYVDSSNTNTWTAVGGLPVKPAKPLNLEFINNVSLSDLVVNPTVSNLTGTEDFTVVQSQFFRDSAGNRDTVTGVTGSLLKDGRKIIVPPNSEVLVEMITSGKAGNSALLTTHLSFIESVVY